jgi:glycine cleavage system H protein
MTDASWRGCAVPPELEYDVERHVWVRMEDGLAVMGMTDVAQTVGGMLVSISFKPLGKVIKRGRSLAVIESAKWVGPFPTPLTCELVETNEAAFERDLLVANRDPYGDGWLAKVRPLQLEDEREHLVDGETALEWYRDYVDKEEIMCFRCVD